MMWPCVPDARSCSCSCSCLFLMLSGLKFFPVALQEWRRFGKLAWASCAMKILEAWSAGITILLAGLLPSPEVAVASLTVASDLYTVLSMAFLAGGMAACAR